MAVEPLHGPDRRRRAEEMLRQILGSMGIRVPHRTSIRAQGSCSPM